MGRAQQPMPMRWSWRKSTPQPRYILFYAETWITSRLILATVLHFELELAAAYFRWFLISFKRIPINDI
jgi:hypothetical protein